MIDKMFYKTLLKNTFSIPAEITFWDGETVQYGESIPQFKLIFKDIIPKRPSSKNHRLLLGRLI